MISDELKALANAVSGGYGIALTDVEETFGGNDPFARLFTGVDSVGGKFFIKLRTGLNPGIVLSATLHASGIAEVLAPIETLDGNIAYPLGDKTILVYSFKEGTNGFEHPLALEHWRSVGQSLRKIHDADLPKLVLSQLMSERFLVDDVPQLQTTCDRLLAEQGDTPAEAELAQLILTNRDAINQVIAETERLGIECRSRQWDLVPCHSDLHVGNVLVEANGFINLIDWDAPRLAPRECDLLFFCGGGILDAHGDEEEASFFEGYGQFTPDPTAMAYYRLARTLEDLVSYAREATDMSATPEQQAEAVRWFARQFKPRKQR